MPRLLASMMRFSIWSLMPRPWRPPMAFASCTNASGESNCSPSSETGHPASKRTVTSSVVMATEGSQWRTSMIGCTISIVSSRFSSVLASCVAPHRLASVEYAFSAAARYGRITCGEPLAHLVTAADPVDEGRVEPRLVDPQLRVDEQPIAVEPLDVVALERGAVAPHIDAVGVHGPHEQRAGDGPAERCGVEYGLPPR